MKTIAIANKKGGVGKTTSTLNIGAGLQRLEHKVLLIDLDSQANLTTGLGFEKHTQNPSIYEVLADEADVEEALLDREGLFLLPSSKKLQAADKEFLSEPDWQFMLLEALESIQDFFHYAIIDCPPHLGFLTYNAIAAADEVFIPVQAEYFALEGLNDLMGAVNQIKKRINPKVVISGLFATRYSSNKVLNRQVVEAMIEQFPDLVFETRIRENLALAEAPSHGKSIFEYMPYSNGAQDYMSLCNEVVNRNGSK